MRNGKWPSVRLANYVDLLCGFAFKSKHFTDDPNDIPLVKGANVHQGYIDWGNAKYWSRNDAADHGRYFLETGDVVLAMDRPWIEAGLKFSWIRDQHPRALLVQRVARMRGINGLESSYLRFLIGSHHFTDYIKPIVTGINVPHISADQIKGFQFAFPPTSTQRKIAAVLSAYDDLIENNTRRIAILEEMAQAIYREWFVNFRFPGHEQVKLVDSPVGEIPEGWEVVKFEDAISIKPKVTVPKEGEKHFVSMGAVPHNTMLIDVATVEMRTGNSGSRFQNGDTLFARITPCLENGKTAFVQFLESLSDVGFGSTEFIVLRSRTVCPEFVYLLARSDPFRDNAIKSMSGATGRQRVQEKCFDNFFIAHPDAKTLSEFTATVQPLFRQVFALDKKNRNLRATRDLLLPKLISGQLDVEELDIETGEPLVEAEA